MPADQHDVPPSGAMCLKPPAQLPAKWILVWPSVSVGNDAQLAMDLLLASLPFDHLGHLLTCDVLPFAALSPAVPHHKTSLVTGLEVYKLNDSNKDVIVVQQRSPSAKGRAATLAKTVVEWARNNGCVELLVLSSAHSAGLQGRPMSSLQQNATAWAKFRVAASTAALEGETFRSRAVNLPMPVLESLDNDPRGWSSTVQSNVDLDLLRTGDNIPRFLPTARKGSFVRTALEECEAKGIPMTTVIHFVHEGDNAQDARTLASATAILLRIASGVQQPCENEDPSVALEYFNTVWKSPTSWYDPGEVPQGLF